MVTRSTQPGRVLLGRYRLVEKLGEGGMGTIWRAEHLVLKAPVAVKMIDRDVVNDDETKTRFIREAQAAAALRSPHVVQILDYGVEDKVPFIVMELLEGETLAQRLRRIERLEPSDTALIIAHMARAIGRAHEAGIVHRDLKPENVFLVQNEDELMAKVLDFGVAKIGHDMLGPEGTRTRTGSLLGTPYYMSPEQAQGNKEVDHRSDLWSLGVIAFECLTGKRPFTSDGLGDLVLQICVRDIPVPSRMAAVPLGFDAWFARAAERNLELRYQSARELSDALREALGITAPDPATSQPEVLVSTAGLSVPPEDAAGEDLGVRGSERAPEPFAITSEAPSSSPPLDPTARSTPSRDVSSEDTPAALTFPRLSARGRRDLVTLPRLPDSPALTLDQFSTTSHKSLVPRSPRSWLVFGVAVSALMAGVALGILLLAKPPDDQAERALPVPQMAASQKVEPAALRARFEDDQPENRAVANEAEPPQVDEEVSETDAPDAGVADQAATEVAPRAIDGSVPRVSDAGLPDEADASSNQVDSGWVKPAWAIPDDEVFVVDSGVLGKPVQNQEQSKPPPEAEAGEGEEEAP